MLVVISVIVEKMFLHQMFGVGFTGVGLNHFHPEIAHKFHKQLQRKMKYQ